RTAKGHLDTVVVAVRLVHGLFNVVVAGVSDQGIVRCRRCACLEGGQVGVRHQVNILVKILVSVLGSHIGNRQHRLAEGLLHTEAELRASRRLIVIYVKPLDVVDRNGRRPGTAKDLAWAIVEKYVLEVGAGRQGNGSGVVVHVIALDAFVHDAVATANDGLAVAVQIVGKANARLEVQPGIVNTAPGSTVLSAGRNAIDVELLARQLRVRTWAKARAVG